MRSTWICVVAAIVVCFPLFVSAEHCTPPSPKPVDTVIAFDHDGFDRTIRIGTPSTTDWTKVKAVALDPPPRVGTGTVGVLVLKTNTALYSYDATGTAKPSDEIAAVQGFVKALKPYMAAAAKATINRMQAAAEPRLEKEDPRAKLIAALEDLEAALWGSEGLERARAAVIRRIHASKTPFEPPVDPGEKDHGPVESYFEVTETKQPCTPCGVQAFTIKASLKAKSKLQTTHSELASNVAPLLGSDDSDTKELVAAATDALANYPDFLATAAAVEKAGRRLMAATVEKCLTDGIDRVQLSKAVDLVATVTPIDLGVGAVHAPLSPVTVKTTARPDWLFRPALGVSLLRATDAKYPTYGAKEVADGFEVVENGVQDSRVDWALMLSFAPRGLDWRDSNGFAVWLPTLLVNPSDSVSALGFGLGLSYKALKLDAGFIWTKHPVLDDQIVGQHLGAAEDLRTETGYGKGKFFVGFSIVGWAPFKSE